jgi:predicted GNAT superfamily acetyltransferase
MRIRNALPVDFTRILALNGESVHFLSPMSLARLNELHGESAYHRVVDTNDGVCAFLLALREGASYDSANYLWFQERYSPNEPSQRFHQAFGFAEVGSHHVGAAAKRVSLQAAWLKPQSSG